MAAVLDLGTGTIVTTSGSEESTSITTWSSESLNSSYSTQFFNISQSTYQKEVTELTYEEFSKVVITTINQSFSSESSLSSKLKGLSITAKEEAILGAVLTAYRPLLVLEWHAEFEKQIEV